MIARICCILTFVVAALGLGAQTPGGRRTATEVSCASDLGVGVKTKRQFCDVLITTKIAESVSMTVPEHVGPATLSFDLHNRFDVPAIALDPGQAFRRHLAMVAVVRPSGQLIERAAVSRDFRGVDDLFDRIGTGGRSGLVKAIGPGVPEPIRIALPPDVAAIGIVGLRLDVLSRTARGSFDPPGRPIAIVSNVRIDYTPRR